VDWRHLRIQELPSTKATAAESAPEARPWKSLYDGRSLRGWRVPADDGAWKASDWTLRGLPGLGGEASILWSETPFHRDEVIFDWRWEGKVADRVPPLVFRPIRGGAIIRIPELASLRKSYGLSPLVNGDHPFHITVAVRRKSVLQENGVRKAAADATTNYDCNCAGRCTCPENCVCKKSGYCGSLQKRAADKLPGGVADGMPDSKFPPQALAEGIKHEHEHTSNDQAAKEIAKDHLSEDSKYYEKVKQIEKASDAAHKDVLAKLLEAKSHSDNKRYDRKTAILRELMQKAPQDWVVDDAKPKYKGVTHTPTNFRLHTDPTAIPPAVKVAENVYMNQLRNMYSLQRPITYDYNKPVFENIRDQMMEVKRRGDFMINARENHNRYMAALSPQYRYELAMKAMRGELKQPSFAEQTIHNYGDHFLNMALGQPK